MRDVSTTIKTTLAILTLLVLSHASLFYKIHNSTALFQHYDNFDHRHLEGKESKTRSLSFDPITITTQHLNSKSSLLPEALRYPLYTNTSLIAQNNPKGACCQMASVIGKTPTPKNIMCDGICHTERACSDLLYPFKSIEEAKFFTEKRWDMDTISATRAKCRNANMRLTPPYTWCHQWMTATNVPRGVIGDSNNNSSNVMTAINLNRLESYNHQNIYPFGAKLPPPGCSRLSEGGGSGSYQHLTLFPEGKLAFCGIPKISITQWLQFLRFTFGAKDYQSFPHAKPDVKLMRFDKLEEDSQQMILNDPDWKFAVFLRNPAERLLSAYLDKVNGSKRDKDHFLMNYNMTDTPTFAEFVHAISRNRTATELGVKSREKLHGVDWFTDPHWRPQSFSCGLSEFLPRFSYIGSLDKIEDQARELLQKVGLWDHYGKYYHRFANTKDVKQGICTIKPPELNTGDKLFGFLQLPMNVNEIDEGSSGAYRHSHHSTGSQSKLDSYYTSELKSLVEKKLYPMDVKLWNLVHDEDNLVSGSELATRMSDQCMRRAKELSASAST